MALYKFLPSILMLITVCYGPSAVQGAKCADQEVNECVASLGDVVLEGAAKTCKTLKEVKSCLANVENSCEMSDSQKHGTYQARQQIESMMSMCQVPKDGCYSKAEKCMLPFEEMYNQTILASKICPVMEETTTCLKKLVSGCESKELKKTLETSIDGVVEQGKTFKCKDAGYTITGMDGKGVTLQPTVAIFILSTALIVFTL